MWAPSLLQTQCTALQQELSWQVGRQDCVVPAAVAPCTTHHSMFTATHTSDTMAVGQRPGRVEWPLHPVRPRCKLVLTWCTVLQVPLFARL